MVLRDREAGLSYGAFRTTKERDFNGVGERKVYSFQSLIQSFHLVYLSYILYIYTVISYIFWKINYKIVSILTDLNLDIYSIYTGYEKENL